jgi:hypothetical protein
MRHNTTPNVLLATLAKQHADLRERIARCELLAERLDAGLLDPAQLLGEVAALRSAFEQHNQFEERVLTRLLRDAEWLGALRVSRIVKDHIEEHRAIRRDLATGPAAELCAVLSSLRTHLDTEERYFVAPSVRRDDLAGR